MKFEQMRVKLTRTGYSTERPSIRNATFQFFKDIAVCNASACSSHGKDTKNCDEEQHCEGALLWTICSEVKEPLQLWNFEPLCSSVSSPETKIC